MSKLQVAAGVVVNPSGQILIARRHDHLHQGGLWEFPGGKIEAGETPLQALARELLEEVDIEVQSAEPLIVIRHAYPDRKVRLHVWRVNRFSGEPVGLQGQPLRWVEPADLGSFRFPEANRPITNAARLPDRYALLDLPSVSLDDYRQRLAEYHGLDIKLIRLRANRLSADQYRHFAHEAVQWCKARGIKLLLNGDTELLLQTGASGLHLRSDELMALDRRPVDNNVWLATSCHDKLELRQAARIGVDFAVLSPVNRTATHPELEPMGWEGFSAMVEDAFMPVFALGGLNVSDLRRAKECGAQGIAAIRGFSTSFASD